MSALTPGQQLIAQAAQAADVRDALTHPDVVALRVERIRDRVDRLMWAGIVIGLLFTATTVQQFAASNAPMWSATWWAAWLIDPTVSVVLLGVLVAERETARWQLPIGGWPRFARWALLAATYAMNTWAAWAAGSPTGVILHSVPPLAVFIAAEAVTGCQDRLTECVHRAHAYAAQRKGERSASVPEAVEILPQSEGADDPSTAVGHPASTAPSTAPRPRLTSSTRPADRGRTSQSTAVELGDHARSILAVEPGLGRRELAHRLTAVVGRSVSPYQAAKAKEQVQGRSLHVVGGGR